MLMEKISWKKFEVKNENPRKSFEELCYHVFCRRHGLKEGVKADYDQVGLETYPVKIGKKYYGFQAKFFDHTPNLRQIRKSVDNAINAFRGQLDIITIYLNTKSKPSADGYKEIGKIAAKAGIEIEWFASEGEFDATLLQPLNLDLRQLYFDESDELGFIKKYANKDKLTFLQSDEYLALPIEDINKQKVADLIKTIQSRTSEKQFLVVGNPGSGKSILMHKLFQQLAGLDQNDANKMLDYLTKQGAIPMLVNLKNCATDSLENILRERQNDNRVRGKSLDFIYLFDGLDELSEENCDNILSYIAELVGDKNTKKIIFSCRSSNANRYKAKTYFKNILGHGISYLDESHIDKFFKAKKNKEKQKKLKILKTDNPHLIAEIKDILLINLLWDTIDELDASSTIIDLFDKKIHLLLDDHHHKKNIESLNLLNSKKDSIISLNQEISFEFQKKFQFLFKQEDLQNLILQKFPRIDYHSVNAILNYSASLFFDHSYSPESLKQGYVYQHRRYQEYFFAQKLKTEYENDPKIIRDLGIIANREFFEKIFLNYLRKEYVKEANLGGLTEINLIRVYLGGHPGFGHDDACYKTSSPTSASFIAALASQNRLALEELLSNDTLEIKDKLMIDSQELERHFKIWKKDKKAYRSEEYLKNVWGEVSSLIRSVTTFWKSGKSELGNEIKRHLSNILSFYEQKELKEIQKKSQYNPFWMEIENWIYIRIRLFFV